MPLVTSYYCSCCANSARPTQAHPVHPGSMRNDIPTGCERSRPCVQGYHGLPLAIGMEAVPDTMDIRSRWAKRFELSGATWTPVLLAKGPVTASNVTTSLLRPHVSGSFIRPASVTTARPGTHLSILPLSFLTVMQWRVSSSLAVIMSLSVITGDLVVAQISAPSCTDVLSSWQ
ncbi:hypothetical protein EDB86DRAFT_2075986 [Lactarius hatsudake]|nr:hypothetical protein EDB86DRAFT_2075986 [Lactarius hatsudake]